MQKLRRKFLGLLGALAAGCGGSGSGGAPGALGDPGPAGGPGPTGSSTTETPVLADVVPRVGLLGRELDVVVTTEHGKIDRSAAFDFGSGVTVDASKTVVLGDSGAKVHLTIDKAAPVGDRDVRLTIAGTTLVGNSAFAVAAPLQVSAMPPLTLSAPQGGLLAARLFDLDSQGWDPKSMMVKGPGYPFPTNPSAATTSLFMIADPLAPLGGAALELDNLARDGSVAASFLSNPHAFTVTSGTPQPLTVGTPLVNQSVAAPFATAFYSWTTQAAAIVRVHIDVTGSTIFPFMAAYPKSGAFADLTALSYQFIDPFFGFLHPPWDLVFSVDDSTQSHYLVIFDESVGGGLPAEYGFNLRVTSTPATIVKEAAGPHSTPGSAQDVSAGAAAGVIINGSCSTGTEIDGYAFNGTQGDLWELSLEEQDNSPTDSYAGLSEGLGAIFYNIYDPESVKPFAPGHSGSTETIFNFPLPDTATWYAVVWCGAKDAGQSYTLTLRKER